MKENEPPRLDKEFFKEQEKFALRLLKFYESLLISQDGIKDHFERNPDHSLVLNLHPSTEEKKQAFIKKLQSEEEFNLDVTDYMPALLGLVAQNVAENLIQMGKDKEVIEIANLYPQDEGKDT